MAVVWLSLFAFLSGTFLLNNALLNLFLEESLRLELVHKVEKNLLCVCVCIYGLVQSVALFGSFSTAESILEILDDLQKMWPSKKGGRPSVPCFSGIQLNQYCLPFFAEKIWKGKQMASNSYRFRYVRLNQYETRRFTKGMDASFYSIRNALLLVGLRRSFIFRFSTLFGLSTLCQYA